MGMKRGWFRAGQYGRIQRNRSDWRHVRRSGGAYYDVMGTKSKTKRGAAEGNAFIRAFGL